MHFFQFEEEGGGLQIRYRISRAIFFSVPTIHIILRIRRKYINRLTFIIFDVKKDSLALII